MRVLPKPSRVTYPCQQVAASIGGTFILYLLGAIGSMALFQQIKNRFNRKIALGYLVVVVMVATIGYGIAQIADDNFVPNTTVPEGVNNPMGVAKGIYPGRVAWTQDFNATSWDEENGIWWDDNATSQTETDKMMSTTLRNLTGAKTDKEAWKKLFEYNNKMNGRGNKNYSKGEKIVVKLNMNAIHNVTDEWKNQGYPSPHMLNSLIKQLIEIAGVSGQDIILTDPSRFIGTEINDRI